MKINKIKVFSLVVVNTYYFKFEDMREIGKILENSSLDKLRDVALLEISPDGACLGGELAERYRISGKSYHNFLYKVLV